MLCDFTRAYNMRIWATRRAINSYYPKAEFAIPGTYNVVWMRTMDTINVANSFVEHLHSLHLNNNRQKLMHRKKNYSVYFVYI